MPSEEELSTVRVPLTDLNADMPPDGKNFTRDSAAVLKDDHSVVFSN